MLEKLTYKVFEETAFSPQKWLLTDPSALQNNCITVHATKPMHMVYCNRMGIPTLLDCSWEEENWSIYEIGITTCCEIDAALKGHLKCILYDEYNTATIKILTLNTSQVICGNQARNVSIILAFEGSGCINLSQLKVEIAIQNSILSEKKRLLDDVRKVLPTLKKQRPQLVQKKHSNIKIAAILDEFSYNCFKYEADLIQLECDKWEEQLNLFQPEILFVESVWLGYQGEWQKIIPLYQHPIHAEMQRLLSFCNKKGIITVFWHKEGLINFHYFAETSRAFDWIFVTDERLIPYYEQLHTSAKLDTLAFAAQPRLHNPIDKHRCYMGEVAFAGGWYGAKHPDRLRDMTLLLEGAKDLDFTIFDRNFEQRHVFKAKGCYWPQDYWPYIVGNVSYEEMCELYKYYKVFLNANSIQESKVMISRRVYELLMTKTAVVSGASHGIMSQLSQQVFISHTPVETTHYLKKLLENDYERLVHNKDSLRYIMANHTYSHRLHHILHVLGYSQNTPHVPKVLVWVWLDAQTNRVLHEMAQQSYSNLKIQKAQQCLNIGEDVAYVAFVDGRYSYSPTYIEDALNCILYSGAQIVGRTCVDQIDQGDCYTTQLLPGTLVVTHEKSLIIYELEKRWRYDTLSYQTQLDSLQICAYSDDGIGLSIFKAK